MSALCDNHNDCAEEEDEIGCQEVNEILRQKEIAGYTKEAPKCCGEECKNCNECTEVFGEECKKLL